MVLIHKISLLHYVNGLNEASAGDALSVNL